MKATVAAEYVDSLFAAREYEGLVWLSSIICGSATFDVASPTYGLPRPLFLFVEGLAWFAQGTRSGVWTYFEATPVLRQELMRDALGTDGPPGFSEHYAAAMASWRDPQAMPAADQWLQANDDANNAFLWTLASTNRALVNNIMG